MKDDFDDNDDLKQEQDFNFSNIVDLKCDVQQIKEKLINMISYAKK